MKKGLLLVTCCWVLVAGVSAQTAAQRLQKAFGQFEADSQLRHAISSLYVIDANTGEVVFDKNSQVGLAPASTQKIITSVTAYELLGKDYRYRTELKCEFETALDRKSKIKNFFLYTHGDPTLGSWRFKQTNEQEFWRAILSVMRDTISKARVLTHSYLTFIYPAFENNQVNDRWIWQDIGNYYGATHSMINWRENQFDLNFKQRENANDPVLQASTTPAYVTTDSLFSPYALSVALDSLKTGKPGSGDNAYVYYTNEAIATVKGTIPPGKGLFTISASHPDPESYFISSYETIKRKEFSNLNVNLLSTGKVHYGRSLSPPVPTNPTTIYEYFSPTLDSIIYWFNKKSINFYGEALVKTIAYEKQGFGSTDSGIAILKKFWKEKGLDDEELNMYDGSGLSPMNRVTTHAQVEILKFAKTRPWFSSFYHSLPEYNGMKVKSGTIGDVKGFCGYHKAKDGKEYIFSFLVNNYNGRTSPVVNKMYKVLDELK
jgi:serine-type D-Ala-D-Ala carboxypeptidase/endopeptidase (penicillin-binding protein 4)